MSKIAMSAIAFYVIFTFASGISSKADLLPSLANNCNNTAACQDHCGLKESNVNNLEAQCSVDSYLNKKRRKFNSDAFQGSEAKLLAPSVREEQPDPSTLCSASNQLGDPNCKLFYEKTHQYGAYCLDSLYNFKSNISSMNLDGNTDSSAVKGFNLGSVNSNSITTSGINLTDININSPASGAINLDTNNQAGSYIKSGKLANSVQSNALKTKDTCNWYQSLVASNQWDKSVPDKLNSAPYFIKYKDKNKLEEAVVVEKDNALRRACAGFGEGTNFWGSIGVLSTNKARKESDAARMSMINKLQLSEKQYIMQAAAEDLYCKINEYTAELILQKERLDTSNQKLGAINSQMDIDSYMAGSNSGYSNFYAGNMTGLGGGGGQTQIRPVVQAQVAPGDQGTSALTGRSMDVSAAAPVQPNPASSGVNTMFNNTTGAIGNAASSVGSAVVNNIGTIAVVGAVGVGAAAVLSKGSGSGSNNSSAAIQSNNSSSASVSASAINAASAASSSSNVNTITPAVSVSGPNASPTAVMAALTTDTSGISGTKSAVNTTGASSVSSSLRDAVRDRLNNGTSNPGTTGGTNIGGALGELTNANAGDGAKVAAKTAAYNSIGILNASGGDTKAPVAVAGSDTDASIKDIMQNMQAMVGGALEPMTNLSGSNESGGAARGIASSQGGTTFEQEVAAADTAPLFDRIHESIQKCLNKGCIINGLPNKL